MNLCTDPIYLIQSVVNEKLLSINDTDNDTMLQKYVI